LSNGCMIACLNEVGKTLSESDRLTMLVTGKSKESRHDFNRKVGMLTRAHEELEDCIMVARTSSVVAGKTVTM